MAEYIKSAGAIAGAISAVIALLTLILFKPIRNAIKRRSAEKEADRNFRKQVLDSLNEIKDDIGDLQYQSLAQAHDLYMSQRWCPASTKQQLVTMHESYEKKGRNHLSEHYEEEILDLPEHPPAQATA